VIQELKKKKSKLSRDKMTHKPKAKATKKNSKSKGANKKPKKKKNQVRVITCFCKTAKTCVDSVREVFILVIGHMTKLKMEKKERNHFLLNGLITF
jgi:UDP-2,3-diacylglucosamine pyrophosphatase LpxH